LIHLSTDENHEQFKLFIVNHLDSSNENEKMKNDKTGACKKPKGHLDQNQIICFNINIMQCTVVTYLDLSASFQTDVYT